MPRIATTTASSSIAVTMPEQLVDGVLGLPRDVRRVVDGDVGVVGERRLDRCLGPAGSVPGALFIRMAPSSGEVTLAAKSGIVIT